MILLTTLFEILFRDEVIYLYLVFIIIFVLANFDIDI